MLVVFGLGRVDRHVLRSIPITMSLYVSEFVRTKVITSPGLALLD